MAGTQRACAHPANGMWVDYALTLSAISIIFFVNIFFERSLTPFDLQDDPILSHELWQRQPWLMIEVNAALLLVCIVLSAIPALTVVVAARRLQNSHSPYFRSFSIVFPAGVFLVLCLTRAWAGFSSWDVDPNPGFVVFVVHFAPPFVVASGICGALLWIRFRRVEGR